MKFKKGYIPWNKGKIGLYNCSEETKRKLSLINKGKAKPKVSKTMKRLFKEGKLKPWNKGLTKENDERINIMSNKLNGRKCTEETRRKRSKTMKRLFKEGKLKIPSMEGKHHSKETKNKIGLAHKGFKHSEETKIKMVLNNNGWFRFKKGHTLNSGKNHPNYGKHLSKETIKKIKESRAKQILPKKDTSIEVKIQNFLRQLGIEFFTHQYMKDIEHSYQCDILIPNMNLVIECDGIYWHKYPIGRDIDKIRTSELLSKGFKVLRLWEREIKIMDLNKFKEIIN